MPRPSPSSELRKHALTGAQVSGLFAALILPVAVMLDQSGRFDLRLVLGVAVAISLIAYLACAADKRKAQDGRWRTPESTLHLIELAGGWPGSFLAQRRFRHKISRRSYQITFWIIVVLYELAALDVLTRWKLFSALLAFVTTLRNYLTQL